MNSYNFKRNSTTSFKTQSHKRKSNRAYTSSSKDGFYLAKNATYNSKDIEIEISTASSVRQEEYPDFEGMAGFSIQVCGDYVHGNLETSSADDTYMNEVKYAQSKQVAVPRVDTLPQPIFLLD